MAMQREAAFDNSLIAVRRAKPEDAPVCGRICYEAFTKISTDHAFPCFAVSCGKGRSWAIVVTSAAEAGSEKANYRSGEPLRHPKSEYPRASMPYNSSRDAG